MEILALLLLGFIAMLAIVPPIIRGRMGDSPLATTQNFQRSMREMGSSLEFNERLAESPYRDPRARGISGRTGMAGRMRARPSPLSRRRSAEVRRRRVMAALLAFAAVWGLAALLSGATWCLAVFAISASLPLVYWILIMLAPRITAAMTEENREEEAYRPPQREAM